MRRLYALILLIGAFLLFQVQPLIGKAILPWFGSSPSVWTITLFSFQVMLLAGYTYAHLLSIHLSIRQQIWLHLILVTAALIFLPIMPSSEWKPAPDNIPTLRIILLLGATIGLPYMLLATTGPLLQKWLLHDDPNAQPFRLFSVSNIGSLIGLLSYPFIFERFLPLTEQAWLWSGGFLIFVILLAVTGARLLGKLTVTPGVEKPVFLPEIQLQIPRFHT